MSQQHQPNELTAKQSAADSTPDSTERKQSQQRQAFLLQLSDTLRAQPNADAIANYALQRLAEQLQLDRCYIGVYRLDQDRGEFTHQVGNDRVPPVPDSVRLSDFPDALRVAFEGTLVIDDVGQTAGLTEMDRQNLGALGFSALVASTLRHGKGNPLWSIVAISARPRRWTPAEIKLIDEVTERTWDAIERTRAEEALRVSESRTSFLLRLSDTLRPLSNQVDIQYQAARVLGEYLGANRIGYASTQEDERLVAVTLHYKQGVLGIEGVYRYVDYGPQLISDMQAGKTVSRPDIARDSTLNETEKAAHKRLQLGATVNVPLLKQGRLVAILFVHFQHPHTWSAAEVTLIEETAERIWTALERARAEEALRESEARLARELADSQQLQLISSRLIEADDMEGLYQQIMEAAKAIMHADTVSMQRFFPEQKALHLLAWQGFHPESAHFWEWVDVTSASSCGMSLLAGKRVIIPDVEAETSMQGTGDLDAYRRSGLRAVQTTPLISRSGQVVGMLSNHWKTVHTPTDRELGLLDVIVRQAADIVERHQASEALGQSEERFRTLVQNLPDYAIFRIDPAGMITEWTEGAQRVKGYFAEEVIGQHISLFYTPEGIAAGELAQEMEQATQSGRAERESVRIRKGGERFWVNEIMTAIRDGAGRLVGFTKISRDITARKQAEEALQVSDRRKSEFLAMLAHELRNPLSTLHNTLLLLDITKGQDETLPLDRAQAMMSREVTHLNRMIDDLLDVSRISQGKIQLRNEHLDLGKLVQQALEAARSQFFSRQQALTIQVPAEPLWVDGDRTRLTQVVRNLATNAAKYTPKGGQIGVILQKERGQAVLRIRDNGIGIASEQLKAIFEVFVQVSTSLDRPQGGLGLGLAVVKQLVELHGGSIGVHSPGLGQGSDFTVRLPSLPDAPLQPASTGGNDGRTTKAARILVVDDSADLALTTAMLLRHKQYEAHTCLSGSEALEAVELLQPAAILLDLGMPGMDGFETCRRLRALGWGKHGVIVALSGYGQEEDKQRTRESGFDGHLVKPLNLQLLTELLDELLNTVESDE